MWAACVVVGNAIDSYTGTIFLEERKAYLSAWKTYLAENETYLIRISMPHMVEKHVENVDKTGIMGEA